MRIRLFLLVWLALAPAPCGPAFAQTEQPSAPAGPQASLTPAEARRALDVLQDPQKREQLLEILRVIAAASAPASEPAAEPAAAEKPGGEKPPGLTLAPDSLGAEIASRLARWPRRLAEQAAASVRSMPDLFWLGDWVSRMAADPGQRGPVVQAVWQMALVLGAALVLEFLSAYALRRPMARLASRAPDPNETAEVPRQEAWHRLRRLPFAGARLVLEAIPVAVFWVAGSLLAGLSPVPLSRLAILVAVNAYTAARIVLAVGRMLLSPAAAGLRLLRIDNETAAYLMRWLRRITLVAAGGGAAARLMLLFGLHPAAHDGLIGVLGLVVAVLLAVFVVQSRRPVAAWLGSADAGAAVAVWRGWLASVWHYLALLAIAAGWILWSSGLSEGAGGLWLVAGSIAILVAARLAALIILGILDRATGGEPAAAERAGLLSETTARAGRYLGAVRLIVIASIVLATGLVLLQFWGVEAFDWFADDAVGSRLLSALATVALAVAAAVLIWEGANAALERRIARLSEAGTPAHAVRLRTLLPMLRAALLVVIVAIVGLTALSEIGVNIAPLLAGAGIVGIAVGFGSQKLVQDVVTGIFVLAENAIQVGDWITVSGLSGRVEQLSVRNIWLRGADGAMHIVPFSAVSSITNTNRGLGTAAVSVTVAFSVDSDRAADVLREIAAEMREDAEFAPMMLGDLQLWVDSVRALGITLAGIIPCTDAGRWPVQREFNRRLQKRFRELGIDLGLKLGDA